jgi:hypothetical protein
MTDKNVMVHPADHIIVCSLYETFGAQVFQEHCPFMQSGKIDDQIDIVRRPDVFQRHRVCDEQRSCASSHKDEMVSEVIAKSGSDGLQHLQQLLADLGHFASILDLR